jgi:nucleotide-binding universal stress UspA family protein
MKRILLAVDRDGLAESVVPAVVALAGAPGAEVLVVHVVDPSAPDSTWPDASQVIARVVTRLAQEGIQAEGQVRDGSRREVAAQIVAAAEDMGADLIALGSHGRGDVTGMLLGSVGHRVATLTDVPLLVARRAAAGSEGRPVRRLLVAVDGARESRPAVDLAAIIAKDHGAEIRLVHAMQNVAVEGGTFLEPEADAAALFKTFGEPLRNRGIEVSTQALDGFGSPAVRIAAAAVAWNADLLVIGSRRLGELSSLVQGSTSHALLAESDRPVLVAGKPGRSGPTGP